MRYLKYSILVSKLILIFSFLNFYNSDLLSSEIDYLEKAIDFLSKKGKEKEAIKFATKALENNKISKAYFIRAYAKSSLARNLDVSKYGSVADFKVKTLMEEAINDYGRVIKLEPNNYEAYLNRGNLKHNLKNYYGAIGDYSEAIKINSENPLAFRNRANSKNNLNNYEAACFDYREAARKGDEEVKVLLTKLPLVIRCSSKK
tara:strand:- start:22 stop:630 length:609 start_codon:yes stop_codon:yes gene_type:complete